MRKTKSIILIWLVSFSFYSCGIATSNFRLANRQNILKLKIGMAKQEALKTMGTKTVASWGLKTNNPYKSEILRGKDKTFEVVYYWTDMKRNDNAITDDELTPLIFDSKVLIGWGNLFLSETIAKHEIRIR